MEDSQAIDLTAKPFRVGPWLVTPDRHEWRSGTEVRRVPPRLMLLLRCLARAAGNTVTRESLLELVWERRVLNDEVLSRSIADLRQALDDDAREPRFVQTIPKLGYRLIVEVEFAPHLDRSDLEVFASVPAELPNAAVPVELHTLALSSELRLEKPGSVPKFRRSTALQSALVAVIMLALAALWLRQTAVISPQAAPVPKQKRAVLASLSAAELLLARPLAPKASSSARDFPMMACGWLMQWQTRPNPAAI